MKGNAVQCLDLTDHAVEKAALNREVFLQAVDFQDIFFVVHEGRQCLLFDIFHRFLVSSQALLCPEPMCASS